MTPTLNKQIRKYFEAQLSRQEERELLRQLLARQGRHPEIDEALAVMLASRITPAAAGPRGKSPVRLIAGIAASIAALLTVGALLYTHDHGQPQTFAYIDGRRTTDPAEIKKIIDLQLADICESSEFITRTLSDDVADIRDALNNEDI